MALIDLFEPGDPEYEELLLREQEKDAALEDLRQEIITYADTDSEHGWYHFRSEEGINYKFPKRALMWYVFGKMHPIRPLLPEYEPISPSGVKLQLDNRYHTDAFLGAGFNLDDAYSFTSVENHALRDAQYQLEEEMQELVTFDFTILANGLDKEDTCFNCEVYSTEIPEKDTSNNYSIFFADPPRNAFGQRRCIVIPQASIEYDLQAQHAEVIIAEQGGKLAHLAIVAREKGKLLIRMDNACERFPHFTEFRINLNKCTLECK